MADKKKEPAKAPNLFREQRKSVLIKRAALASAISALAAGALFAAGGYGFFAPQKADATESKEALAEEAYAAKDGSIVKTQTSVSSEADTPYNDLLSIKEIIKQNKPAVVGVVSSLYRGTTLVGKNTGTGIIMTQDGYIVTNAHVVEDSYDPAVVLYDGREFTASVAGRDIKSDLAVLKIEADGLICAEFGDSDEVEEGDLAVAIGNPMGMELSGTVTAGIISAVNRDLTINDRIMTLIQTDASINLGNSGGPLINSQGKVIGINSVKIASSDAEGLGFAIPINAAKPIIEDLIEAGHVRSRPVIGISGHDISKSASDFYGMPRGVYVDFVSPGGFAKDAGLKEGDVITGINGKSITGMSELNFEKERFKAGDEITLDIWRDGAALKIDLRLALEKDQ
ncbi:MAG: trypsin-like peptidase domain-containing protein [Clostridia bacterium]|nr:trypsin-like peptidase domain-containing protein [Clostridia bacterium]